MRVLIDGNYSNLQTVFHFRPRFAVRTSRTQLGWLLRLCEIFAYTEKKLSNGEPQ